MRKSFSLLLIGLFTLFFCGQCSKGSSPTPVPPTPPPAGTNDMEMWVTSPNQTALIQKQNVTLSFSTIGANPANIVVDSSTAYQTIDGFGYTLTGGSATLLHNMDANGRALLLQELFGTGNSSIHVSYLRVSIGASDLSSSVFSYDDMPAGQTDPTLAQFSLSQDLTDLIPVLQEILAINPNIKILGSPWSAPLWMKDNESSVGGGLLPQYYSVYAQYFVKYIQAMQAKGITIDAVTVQNEPQHGGNNPSMVLSSSEEAEFVKNHLGPAFQTAGLNTKIIIWDHNCDNPGYPMAILADAQAYPFIDGSAFHLYAGDISALSTVHNAYPDKNVYFTEQWTSSAGSFDGDLKWHIKNVIIGSMRNWSKIALEWNLANDPSFGPHTPGGCTQCKGALTISGSSVMKNVAYYIIGQISKFVPPGSVRISSNLVNNLPNVAFKRPDGKKVLVVLNESTSAKSFSINYKGKYVQTSLNPGCAATYIW
ncbi:MAG: glucosylceramidase [Chitinophagaceae bacterium]|nr:glucosylceramidase [Bacteroidota bacterium]MCC6257817.1 glucosylceramidase [Chitinophagaceae bacterium]MCW5917227.1 glucosylceramidase [Ferruginibacter sp.]